MHSNVHHPDLLRVPEILGRFGKGTEDGRSGLLLPNGCALARWFERDPQVLQVPVPQRFGIMSLPQTILVTNHLPTRLLARLECLAVVAVGSSQFLLAQDLAPRAYVITPIHSNAITLTWGFYDGGLNLSGAIPVTTSGTYNVPVFSYYHSLSFFGRSANVTASLPYGVGNFEAAALGRQRSAYLSGLFDLGVRFSVNLRGGPAMPLEPRGSLQKRPAGVTSK